MHSVRLDKKQFQSAEALTYVRALLSNAWDGGAKVFLISPGNHSKREYEKLAQDFSSRVLTVRSIFGNWLRAISFVMPGSYIGALELNRNDNWANAVIGLAGHGYVVLVVGEGSEVESAVIDAVGAYSSFDRLPKLYEPLSSKFKVSILNAEDPNQVEIESNSSNTQLT